MGIEPATWVCPDQKLNSRPFGSQDEGLTTGQLTRALFIFLLRDDNECAESITYKDVYGSVVDNKRE